MLQSELPVACTGSKDDGMTVIGIFICLYNFLIIQTFDSGHFLINNFCTEVFCLLIEICGKIIARHIFDSRIILNLRSINNLPSVT